MTVESPFQNAFCCCVSVFLLFVYRSHITICKSRMPSRSNRRPSAPTLADFAQAQYRQGFLDNAFGYQQRRDASREQRVRYFLSQGFAVVAGIAHAGARKRVSNAVSTTPKQTKTASSFTTPNQPAPTFAPEISPVHTIMDVVGLGTNPNPAVKYGRRRFTSSRFGPLGSFYGNRNFRSSGPFSSRSLRRASY